jgi:hypothetical protein
MHTLVTIDMVCVFAPHRLYNFGITNTENCIGGKTKYIIFVCGSRVASPFLVYLFRIKLANSRDIARRVETM